jgi:hypothetical protein
MGFLDDLEPTAPPPANQPLQDNPANNNPPASGGFLESLDASDQATKSQTPQAPSWSDIPMKAAVNAPHSAMEFAKNIAQPFIHPIKTAENIGNIGLGVMEKLGLYGHAGYEKYADAVGQMVMDRYGSVDNFKRTLAKDPVGAAADVSAIFTGGGGALARTSRLLGESEAAGNAISAVGRAVDPINAAALAAKGVGKVGAEGVGLLTGTHAKPLEEAARAGYEGGEASKALTENMRGNVPLEDVVDSARDAINNMRTQRGKDYRAGMFDVGQDQTVLNWHQVGQAIQDANDIKTFKGQDLSPETRSVRAKLNDYIIDWMALPPDQFHTPEGFDALKQKIGNLRDGLEVGSPEKKIANEYYGAVRKTILDQVPEYGKVMEGYEKASNLVREIEKTLSLPQNERKGSVDTSLRKLQSVLRNNVNTSYGHREKLVEYLQDSGAPHLISALAGQNLNAWTPRGIVRLAAAMGLEGSAVHPTHIGKVAAVMPLMSPRLMGEAFHGAGRLAGVTKYVPGLNRPGMNAAFQVGRATTLPPMQARGGAVEKALRATKRT